MRWSPLPLMIGSGCCGLFMTLLFSVEFKFGQICLDFGVKLPLVTRLSMWLSELVWHRRGWAVLVPLMTIWPLAMLRMVHAQPTLKMRRRRLRMAWCILGIVCALSVTMVLVETVQMMVLLR
jgi:type II secretory pathway component PulF